MKYGQFTDVFNNVEWIVGWGDQKKFRDTFASFGGDPLDEIEDAAGGCWYRPSNGAILIWLEDRKDKHLLAHECYHAFKAFEFRYGLKIEDKDYDACEEHNAFIIGNIFRIAERILNAKGVEEKLS